MCLSLVACGNKEVSDIEIDGEKVSVTDFLIKHLSEYMNTEEFADREEQYAAQFGDPDKPFAVTKVVELEVTDNDNSIHYLLVKADWWHIMAEDMIADSIIIVVNYDTGEVNDHFDTDENWFELPEGSTEYYTQLMLNGPFCGSDYDGGVLLNDDEKRTQLSKEDIAIINEALSK